MSQENGRIRVKATDNVQVAKVRITILNEQGETLEQGEASLVYGPWWEYETLEQGSLLVEAFDLAGNRTWQEVNLQEQANA